jgi:methionyl-tRNA formyltransferase
MTLTDIQPLPSGIAVLTAGGPHAWIMINALRERFGDVHILQEDGEDQSTFWARRKRMLGPLKVASMQAARIPLKLTKRGTQARIDDLIETHGLNPSPPIDLPVHHISSVNSADARAALKATEAKAVFVVSTRMISAKTLEILDAPFINYHSGINPAYRGMFGGYFALANGEPEHFGATVHLVDTGVDTGDVLYQSQVDVGPEDNFHTYIWVMAAGSRDIVIRAIEDALAGTIQSKQVDLPSKQYFAPTLGGYVWTGLTKGVW